jgi:primosomal protein N' (replication factor Y)
VGAILGVAVDVPLRRVFDYRCPSGVDAGRLQPGIRLWVPFGRRRVAGVLLEVRATSDLPDSKLRAAIALIDEAPVIDPALLDLLRWAADYYRHPPGEVIAAALPATLRSGASALETQERWALTAAARIGELQPLAARAGRLREMVEALRGQDAADGAALATLSSRWREHVRELEKRGWAQRVRTVLPAAGRPTVAVSAGPEPTREQRLAIEAIAAAAGTFAPFLLHGVTGSGKTEVYLRAIAEVVGRGQQALVLVPEISWRASRRASTRRSRCCTRRCRTRSGCAPGAPRAAARRRS